MSAGAPCSICLARVDEAAKEVFTLLLYFFSYNLLMSSTALAMLAAAYTVRSAWADVAPMTIMAMNKGLMADLMVAVITCSCLFCGCGVWALLFDTKDDV